LIGTIAKCIFSAGDFALESPRWNEPSLVCFSPELVISKILRVTNYDSIGGGKWALQLDVELIGMTIYVTGTALLKFE